MRVSLSVAAAVAAAAAALAAGAAQAVGPWPGLAPQVFSPSGDVRYTATRSGGMTTVTTTRSGRVVASAKITGAFGIPAVTSMGEPGGLSPDGRLLVLVEPPRYTSLRAESRFAILPTASPGKATTISLRGEFGFDAISPSRSTLYLIQHVSKNDLVRYVVRAYDLRAHSLLPGAIVDKRNVDEVMRGYPVARTTSLTGRWVYTLYTKGPGSSLAFVHALNTVGRSAFCIDLPYWSAGEDVWEASLRLSGNTLLINAKDGRTVARIDTRTLKAVRP
jgi:hypothetical protein